MVFSSMIFLWIFLPCLLVLYFIAPKKMRNAILLIFSLLFYSWGEPKYIILMIISILVNYIFGLLIDKTKEKKKTIILVGAIVFNLCLLGYFKYFDFLIININKMFKTAISIKQIALPIGISFYTFQIMSYIIDLYRNEIKVQKNIFKLALYISFFPQLIAGPIVKYHDIERQIDNRTVTLDKFYEGVKRFIYGLGKKVIIANTVAVIADYTFDMGSYNELSILTAWLGAICYTIQIYYDFSGYSDMAIGLGKMFGFDFMENFNLPYISKSITDFWRRWHISLSTWFKEYVYIPLGGNRKGKIRTYINLWIVFFITGLWHGASWNFIAWGLFHGLFIFIERLKLKEYIEKFKIVNHIYVMLVVIIAWVFFRAPSLKLALKYIMVMFNFKTLFSNSSYILNSRNVIIIIIGILLFGIIQSIIEKIDKKEKLKKLYINYAEIFALFLIFTISILKLISNTYNPFIYFRF